MKKLLFLFAFALLFSIVACETSTENSETEQTEETEEMTQEEKAEAKEEVDPNQKVFGEGVNAEEAIDFAQMISELEAQDSAHIVTSATVVEVCQKKGCWMTLTSDEIDGQEPIMVKFKDYGFFMPKDLAGKKVMVEGQAKRQITPVDELRHYAEDAGKSEEEIAEITEDKEEIVFIAEGVKIL